MNAIATTSSREALPSADRASTVRTRLLLLAQSAGLVALIALWLSGCAETSRLPYVEARPRIVAPATEVSALPGATLNHHSTKIGLPAITVAGY